MNVKRLEGITRIGVLLWCVFAIAIAPVQAAELKATTANINFLAGSQAQWKTYQTNPLHEYLMYDSTSNFDVVKRTAISKYFPLAKQYSNVIKVNEVTSRPASQANFDGQCVAFVKAVTKTPNIATGSWYRGRAVVKNGKVDPTIPIGTAIATFIYDSTKGRYVYSGHTALYGNPSSTGLNVWDQNYLNDKAVARHCISYTGTTRESNIKNYYVVNIQ